ncbi:MAG: endonuclease [Proteiniphilum sp.]|nr:endonuclease [Proteiniphilum sp.]MDD3908429.1 endonuclease [Proteiniphilum sp.]MDD4415637.1 endonuclease [Proteiniphilum sp.]
MEYSSKRILTAVFLLIGFTLYAQVPEGYYSAADGMSGAELKTALYNIIKDPKVIPYSHLWKVFETTDTRKNNKVWDMYSDRSDGGPKYLYDFTTDRCGSYREEGDCYNREHIMPLSWFNGTKSLESDLFHIYPADGYVNNRRGNLPFGEAGITYWESSNGSKIGRNTFGDYTKTIFEPVDEYKGDFARSLLYVVTAYEDRIPYWSSDQVGGLRYPGFSEWSLLLLLKWHRDDPVSSKEVRRNEEVYKIQGNRNPYIDYPDLVEHVWGKYKSVPFEFKKLTNSFLQIECSPFERWIEDMKCLLNRNRR